MPGNTFLPRHEVLPSHPRVQQADRKEPCVRFWTTQTEMVGVIRIVAVEGLAVRIMELAWQAQFWGLFVAKHEDESKTRAKVLKPNAPNALGINDP